MVNVALCLVTRMWDHGKGAFFWRELVSGYIGYTWFSFTLVKALPHPVSSTNTTNRNRRFHWSLSPAQPDRHPHQIGCEELPLPKWCSCLLFDCEQTGRSDSKFASFCAHLRKVVESKFELLYFLPHYICVTALVTIWITFFHTLPV